MRIAIVSILALACMPLSAPAQLSTINPATMPRIGSVDERFQSYNIEMVEVVGGRFWKPYQNAKVQAPEPSGYTPVGKDPDLYQYRPPIDLSSPRLRRLAAALGPAYVRVSGTWANSVFFQNSDEPPQPNPPAGFNGILTRKQWRGVIDFSHVVSAEIVTSFATSAGTRGSKGVWTADQARELMTYTNSVGGKIAAAEFMNEPTLAVMGGAPKDYDAAAFARDLAVFAPFLRRTSPGTLFLGPGSTGETHPVPSTPGFLSSEDLLKAAGQVFDIFTYHIYAAVSKRCISNGPASQTTADAALSQTWLMRSQQIGNYYSALRDKFEPGKPLWVTETAETACGGNPWASTFLDTFRYLVQHGSLAQQGVQVIMHNTLAASDYGLIDENGFEPRPNYWAALLWHKLMGTTVLDPHFSVPANAYAYAHCMPGNSGGVALLLINADPNHAFGIKTPLDAQRYTLTAQQLQAKVISLNDKPLQLTANDDLPQLTPEPVRAGRMSFERESISFLTIANANNPACR